MLLEVKELKSIKVDRRQMRVIEIDKPTQLAAYIHRSKCYKYVFPYVSELEIFFTTRLNMYVVLHNLFLLYACSLCAPPEENGKVVTNVIPERQNPLPPEHARTQSKVQ